MEKDGKPGEAPELKAYSDMAGENKSFLREIELLIDTSGIPLTVVCDITPVDRSSKQLYLSYSNFIHMYDFALALNARYTHDGHEDEVDQQVMEGTDNMAKFMLDMKNISAVPKLNDYIDVAVMKDLYPAEVTAL